MSYTPQTWANGDIITATKLNNIESGVQSVSNSYTPTTWVNGDIITAVKLNNIEQGIANAGGGSSDFSTAQVTITFGAGVESLGLFGGAFIWEDSLSSFVEVEESCVIQVVLYKGSTSQVEVAANEKTVTVTGGLQYANEILTITGDGTITIS